MSYLVSARKYRPQTFEDVVGQEHITSTLKNALLNDKLAHAFLFCGPRGVGKTTCARLLAKVINMPDPKQALEDSSYAGTDIDVSMNIIELDAASNNSVDHMRTLIEQVRFQPQEGTHKVFIIDEVHMLSTAAFNAFLKTLEEPPPYAIFILATTEKHKILPTIMSRCQLYDFRRIQVVDIIEQLQKIADQEQIQAEYDALYTIAEKADGAMRDALSIYDRIASACEEHITYKDVVDNLNLLDYEYFFKATDHIVREDGPGLILLLDEVLRNGFEGDIFMNGLAKHLRHIMYCKQEPTLQLLQLSDTLQKRYIDQSQTISYSTILNALALTNDADINYPKAKDKRLHIEIALLKICYASRQTKPLTEKKNPSATLTHHAKPIKPSEPAPTPKKQKITEEPAISTKTQVKNADIAPPQSKTQATQNIQTTPKVSSIEALMAAAEETVKAKNVEEKALDSTELEKVWSEYAGSIESGTTKAVLKKVVLNVSDEEVLVYVPSAIAKEEIQAEQGIYKTVRDHFCRPSLMIKVEVDRKKFPDLEEITQRKVFSTKDKYDHLIAINPLLDQLIDDLKLSPDQD